MTGTRTPSPDIVGSLRSEDGVGVVRIEGRYATGIDALWSAITDPAYPAGTASSKGICVPADRSASTSRPTTWTAPVASTHANDHGASR
jgi:hypothetical protein